MATTSGEAAKRVHRDARLGNQPAQRRPVAEDMVNLWGKTGNLINVPKDQEGHIDFFRVLRAAWAARSDHL